MSSIASEAVDVINKIGIFDILVPFIIGAAAMFGILEKVQLFGKDRHDVNALLSIAIGIIMALSFPAGQFLMNFIPLAIILAFFIFIALLLTQWVGIKPEFIIDVVKNPAILIPIAIILLVLIMIGLNGGLDLMSGATNYTGSLGIPSGNVSVEDLANPAILLTQPQVAGAILVLVVFAVVAFMITQKK
jgi:succinate dehydrogenase hydrophobic anchor subunit